jgi:GH24 family phage-related lysozyme (muramidase)
MTTPTTKSYNDARWDAIKKFETTGKPDTAFYLDGSGYVTIGYGTLVNKNGVTNPYAKAVISNADDPVLAQKMVDAFVGSKGTAAEVKASLEGKGFVFDGSKIIGFKDGVDANGKPVITDIKNVLSEAGATKVTEGTIFVEKEKLVDSIEARLKTHFTEEQRAAVLSRVFNRLLKYLPPCPRRQPLKRSR